ncbi:hypothetical protein HZA96_05990 [Candidatus Woesearchaeota archaeon]|nr:hypothetical protein [Candidatus Woesearchaeota archaeon]
MMEQLVNSNEGINKFLWKRLWIMLLPVALLYLFLLFSIGFKSANFTLLSFICITILFFLPAYLTALFFTATFLLRIVLMFAFAPVYLYLTFFLFDQFFRITQMTIIAAYLAYIIALLFGIFIAKKKIFSDDAILFLSDLSLRWSKQKLIKILFFLSLALILWIVVVLPYFTQDNLHFMVSADIADYIKETGHYPFVSGIHNSVWVIYYPPLAPYMMSFASLFQLFETSSILALYSLLPLLYFIAFLLLLYFYCKEHKLGIMVFYFVFFLLISSTVIARIFISQITNDLFTLFFTMLLIYLFSYKELFNTMENKFYLLILFIGFSFLARPYLGIAAAMLFLIILFFRWNDFCIFLRNRFFELFCICILALFLVLSWYGHVYYATGNPFYSIPSDFFKVRYDENPAMQKEIVSLAEKSFQLTWQGSFSEKINGIFLSKLSFESFQDFVKSFFISISNIAANPFSLLIILLLSLLLFAPSAQRKNYRQLFTINIIFFALILLLWLFVDNSLQSPKFFYLAAPSIYLFAAVGLFLFLQRINAVKMYHVIIICLFAVFLINLVYLGFGDLQQNFSILRNPFASHEKAAEIELKEIPFFAAQIALQQGEQILFLSRAETTAAAAYFLEDNNGENNTQQKERKYIWNYLWYDSEKAVLLHGAKTKEAVMQFLSENNVKYIITAKERLALETIVYKDAEHPQLLSALLIAEDKSFKKVAETSQLNYGGIGKNLVLYEVVYN